jgi:hypothetical protein
MVSAVLVERVAEDLTFAEQDLVAHLVLRLKYIFKK